MASEETSESDALYDLLQHTYFDNIDGADASAAVEALHEDVEWVHTQVWEHDGHTGDHTDVLHGREAVYEFLAPRIGEMQDVGIQHKVREAVADGETGAFRAEVVGPNGDTKPFLGWVELEGGLVSSYTVAPTQLPE